MSDFQQATAKLQQWIEQQLKQGISKQQLYFYLLKRDFAQSMIDLLLDGYQPVANTAAIEQLPEILSPEQSAVFNEASHYFSFANIRLTTEQKRFQLPVSDVQIFKVPQVVEAKLCEQLIIRSRRFFSPSEVVGQKYAVQDSGRSSTTALVRDIAADVEKKLQRSFGALLGIDPRFCEPLQIQCYQPGQAYQNHADWFDKAHPGYKESIGSQGQRTWTCLVYLNEDFEGGETLFTNIKQQIKPATGSACIWNNLQVNGEVNSETYHQGLPVKKGTKYILTAWFRAKPL
ncbi:prolyl hydroxylase family protein [Planctobacterium marinum]|uniref:Fe2OG dioxygenase domain-containing protein n=1 Tax=Planctobacterium marinum TaxID=1631968 RepID=A0AA48KS65_9ALTE|nr:hypothetical protein MACH26_23330 [Planctobacterium marinum]